MTGLVDLHVLRRISEADCSSLRAIAADCAQVPNVDRRVRELELAGLLSITLTPTDAGRAALSAEPTHMRDKPGLTNR